MTVRTPDPPRHAPAIYPATTMLRCPRTGLPLKPCEEGLRTIDGARVYPVTDAGVPHFAPRPERRDARIQQTHYDRIATIYVDNLESPHTAAYNTLLDRIVLDAMGDRPAGNVAEICCGRGDGLHLLARHRPEGLGRTVGIDISGAMLARAAAEPPTTSTLFLQGEATALPLADDCMDTVLMLGGIHHVNDREGLFSEIARVLRPGGRLVFREPIDDLWLWRGLRWIVYRVSPTLDAATERPLRRQATRRGLREAGLQPVGWRTCGAAGFCIFMNSDVLKVNRLLRFVPGIRHLGRMAATLDEWTLRLPGLRNAGLQVIGAAIKDPSLGS